MGLWGNRNWPPSMKVEKIENFHNKRGLMGCKWSSMNAPGTENPLSHPLWGWMNSLFPINKNWPLSVKVDNFLEQ